MSKEFIFPAEPTIIKNMPFEDYRAVQALSAGGIKKIIVSIPEFLGDEEEDEFSFAKTLGKAYHSLILEGKEAFDSEFCSTFEAPENALKTKDDYVVFAERYPSIDFKKSCTKDLIKEAIKTTIPEAPFYEDLEENHYQGRAKIGGKDFGRLEYFHGLIEKSTLGETLKTAQKEVSFFWQENGLPCKARLDAFSEENNFIFDLKTFTNPSLIPPERFFPLKILNMGYHIQAAFYTRAYNVFFKRKAPRFFFLFLQTKGGKAMFPFEFLQTDPIYNAKSAAWIKADEAIDQGLRRYKQYLKGENGLKYSFSPLGDDHFPMIGYK